jgi:hypothetical protein
MADPLPIVCPFCEHVPDNCEVRVCAKHREHDKASVLADATVGMAVREVAANAMRDRDAAITEVARIRGELDAARAAVARISPLLYVLDQWHAFALDKQLAHLSGPDHALVNAIGAYTAGAAAPLTVAAALMLTEVRSGAKWVEWTRPDDGSRWRVEAVGDELGHRWRRDGRWSALFECSFTLIDLDAACTLVDPEQS